VLEISSFRSGEIEVFAPLKFYPALVDSFLPTFRDSPSIPYSGVKWTNLSGVNSQQNEVLKDTKCVLFGQDITFLNVNRFDSWIEHWNVPKWTLEILMKLNFLSPQWTLDYMTQRMKLLIPTAFIWSVFCRRQNKKIKFLDPAQWENFSINI